MKDGKNVLENCLMDIPYYENIKNMSGIYIIRIKNYIYIGSSSKFSTTFLLLSRMMVNNVLYNAILQKIINEEGFKNVRFDIIELCDKSILQKRKLFYIDFFDTINNGLNILEELYSLPENNVIIRKLDSSLSGIKRTKEFCDNVKIGLKKYFESNPIRNKTKWSDKRRKNSIDPETGRLIQFKNKGIDIELVKKIKEEKTKGLSNKEISNKLNIGYNIVKQINGGRTYKFVKL